MHAASSLPDRSANRRIWFVLAPAMLLPTLSALFYFVIFDEASVAKPIYIATKIFTLIWPILATILILKLPIQLNPPNAQHRRSLVPGILIGLAIVAVMVIWMKSSWGEFILSGGEGVRTKVESLGFLDHFIYFAIFITLAHSFIEEFYWRWFVFGNLRKVIRPSAAHAIAAIGFAAHHLVVTCQYYDFWFALLLASCVAVGGLIWSLLFQRFNSLFGSWLCHACVDAGLMWVGYQMIFP